MESEKDVFLVSLLSEGEIKNIIPKHPEILRGNLSQPDGRSFGSNESLSSTSSSSSSSSSSSASSTKHHRRSKSADAQIQTGLDFKEVKYDGDTYCIITRVPDRLSHMIRINDILWHINGKNVRRMKKEKIRKKLRKLTGQHDNTKTLTLRRWKTPDVMTELKLIFTTKLTKREIRDFKWTTKQPKSKFIQIDCFANRYASVDGEQITALPYEESKASSYYFYIWTFRCQTRWEGSDWEPYFGFTWSCSKDGQNYDIGSDLTNPSSPNLLRMKPHLPLHENSLDERYFLIHKLSSRESVIESLLYKDICVAYDMDAKCLVLRGVEKISSEKSIFLYRMYTQTSFQEEIVKDGASDRDQKSITVTKHDKEQTKIDSCHVEGRKFTRKSGTTSLLTCCFGNKRSSSYKLDTHRTKSTTRGRISIISNNNDENNDDEENDDDIFLVSEFIKFVNPECVVGGSVD